MDTRLTRYHGIGDPSRHTFRYSHDVRPIVAINYRCVYRRRFQVSMAEDHMGSMGKRGGTQQLPKMGLFGRKQPVS